MAHWTEMTNEQLALHLIERCGCPEEAAPPLASSLISLDADLKELLSAYFETQQIDSTITVEGYTMDSLVNEIELPPPSAIVTLQWLRDEPKAAIRNMRDRRSFLPTYKACKTKLKD